MATSSNAEFSCPEPGRGDGTCGFTGLRDGEPFLFVVASQVAALLHLTREHQLTIWRRVVDLYRGTGRRLPDFLQDMCSDSFVDELLENEVFWGMVGHSASREIYSRATDFLPAVYATAALLAARQDRLHLSPEDQSLFGSIELTA